MRVYFFFFLFIFSFKKKTTLSGCIFDQFGCRQLIPALERLTVEFVFSRSGQTEGGSLACRVAPCLRVRQPATRFIQCVLPTTFCNRSVSSSIQEDRLCALGSSRPMRLYYGSLRAGEPVLS